MRQKLRYLISGSITVFCIFLDATNGIAQPGYDIYAFDVKSGTSKKLTAIAGAGEFNVTWLNNGKKIAYDVVGGPAAPYDQSIFVTDLETGLSTLLTGAEGGNDAAWSPGGENIAFDDWHIYPYSIYSVPANGGARSILRYNAHHASWNPAGNKIAFDDNYGYIGTKDINTGLETFVTWYGDRPSWSPNGQYIAFDGAWWIGGGIWMIKVDSSGYPLGWPVQLTTSGYGPTWQNNSKEIVYIDWPDGDPNLYSIPVTGGTATKLCGRVGGFDKGDYDPSYSNNGQFVAWSGYSDDPSAPLTNTSKENKETKVPDKNNFTGLQNYPNPFTTRTTIGFTVPEATHVVVSIYNLAGQELQTLADADYKAGSYTLQWDGKNKNRQDLPAGIYLCQLKMLNDVRIKKMMLIR